MARRLGVWAIWGFLILGQIQDVGGGMLLIIQDFIFSPAFRCFINRKKESVAAHGRARVVMSLQRTVCLPVLCSYLVVIIITRDLVVCGYHA